MFTFATIAERRKSAAKFAGPAFRGGAGGAQGKRVKFYLICPARQYKLCNRMNDAKTNPETPPGGMTDQHQWMLELEAAKSAAGPVEQPSPQRSGEKKTKRKSVSSLAQTLKKILLFHGLSPSLIQKILRICTLKSYNPQDILCTGGDHSGEEM